MKSIIFIILLIGAALSAFAQESNDPSALSKTDAGKRVLGYFAAFNSGDEEKLKTFFLANVSPEALKQRPVEPRLEFHRQLRSELQSFEIKRVLSQTETEIELLVQAKNGNWLHYSFRFEKNAPQMLVGWHVEQAEAPDNSVKIDYKAPTTRSELLATIEKYMSDLAAADKFSGVVLITKDDKPFFSKAYGYANRENKTPNTLETSFNLVSINKIFTRIAIGQLVREGKISFDDKLGKFLPDYANKDAREKVTVRHLVTMKSGIGDFFGALYAATPKDKLRKNGDFIPLFADQPLAFEPGSSEQYSNGGYILLGAIIEKVTGKSYYDYVRENVFKPAGMTGTESFENDKMPANTANGYTRRNTKNELVNNISTRPFRGSAAGGGYSNVADLLKFSMALKSGKLQIPDNDGQPRKDFPGLGVAGGADGINAILIVNPPTGYTIIVLSNLDPSSAEKPGMQIRDWTKLAKE
jgi:D-alanyl-D-alanine carboxypeptidase